MNKKPGIDTRRLCYQFTNFGNTNLDITKCPLILHILFVLPALKQKKIAYYFYFSTDFI